jgi:hypothetical protein
MHPTSTTTTETPPAAAARPAAPTLSGAFFNELAGSAIALRLLADALKPSLKLACGSATLGEACRQGGRALGTIHKLHEELSDEQLMAWAARAAQVAAMATATAVTCLAEFIDREAKVGTPPRAARGTAPVSPSDADSGEAVLWCHPDSTPGAPPYGEPTCTACGCTERNACHSQHGHPCSWLRIDAATNAGTCTACGEP